MKRAYRKKALELHPDRNYGSVEAATQRFAEVQSAYEVLSDPQERAWYDSHRDSILRGGNEDGEHYEHNVRVTTAEDIMQMFSKFNRRIDFSDSPTGFYGALREFFDGLAREEEAACEWNGLAPVEYPSFGHKDDDHEDVVRVFYSVWNGFATKKAFSWKDIYNYFEAPDRQVRRMMEKENRRLRDEGARAFNDAVRSLVAFVRKRDPRYKANKQSEEERQKILRDAAAAQAARSRAANLAKFQMEAIPSWMRTSTTDTSDVADDEWAESTPMREEVECVVCSKTFKSEKQYEAHEKSKKHIKAAEQIRRQMQREDRDISLDLRKIPHDSSNVSAVDMESVRNWQEQSASERPKAESSPSSREESVALAVDRDRDDQEEQNHDVVPDESAFDSVSDEDYAPRENVEQRLFNQDCGIEQSRVVQNIVDSSLVDALANRLGDDFTLDDSEITKRPRSGKAKEKRAKKAAQKSSISTQLGAHVKCAACLASFPSRTQLFRHLHDSGHDQPVAKVTNSGVGKR